MEYILGIIVSLVVQWVKKTLGTDRMKTMFAVLVFSFVAAAVYVLVEGTSIWPMLLRVMTVAGAFYTFIIRNFE